MSHSRLVAAVLLSVCLLLRLRPSSAQPVAHSPDGFLHGWSVEDFAASRNPSTPWLLYVVDGRRHVVAIDARDGSTVYHSDWLDGGHSLSRIAVDSRNYVLVTAYNWQQQYHVLVLDEQLRQVKSISSSSLDPPLAQAYNLQLAVDSSDTVYLFNSNPGVPLDGQVWALNSREWRQTMSWRAPVNTSNSWAEQYVLAIDNQDYLYFQQTNGAKQLVIADQKGTQQFAMQLGSGSESEPWISDVVVDAQLQMWHVFADSSTVALYSDEGELVGSYDVLTAGGVGYSGHIDIDQLGAVRVSDWAERALLTVSARGDVTSTLASRAPPMWQLTSLMADYGGGRDNGSLLFGDYGSPFIVKRISVDGGDWGGLVQRYSLPAHLASNCYDSDMDVGARTGNIHALLQCWESSGWISKYHSLVYVMSRAGRVVSETRVDRGAYNIVVDEQASVMYIAALGDTEDVVIAYSTADGRQLANYSATPGLRSVTDLILLPSSTGGAASLLVVDPHNRRFVTFDPSSQQPSSVQPFPASVVCTGAAYSPQQRNTSVFYAGCYRTDVVNGSSVTTAYVHKWDVTDPQQPRLTDSFELPKSMPTQENALGDIVIGLDGHLYAYDWGMGSLWQWEDADRTSVADKQRSQQQVEQQPRVHVGRPVLGLAGSEWEESISAETQLPVRPPVLHKRRRMRGAGWE